MNLQKYLIKSFKFPILIILITSTTVSCFAFLTAIIWLISQSSNIFSGQATKDEYLLFFVVFNIVLTSAILIYWVHNFEKKEVPNKSSY